MLFLSHGNLPSGDQRTVVAALLIRKSTKVGFHLLFFLLNVQTYAFLSCQYTKHVFFKFFLGMFSKFTDKIIEIKQIVVNQKAK